VSFAPHCHACGLHGDDGCYLRFSKSPRPKYVYEHRQVGLGVTSWCVGVFPKPRHVRRPDSDTCEAWRDASGNSAEEVRRAMAAGEYRA
jgi:hypothetical protein